MITSSHRLRAEEKRLWRRLISTFVFFLLALLFLVYVGLPLFAKIIVFLGSFRSEKPTANTTAEALLLPPILESTFEATNSARLSITGFGQKEATIKIFVNDKKATEVLADNEGKFKVTNLRLSEGANTITAKTVKNGQESSFSSALTVLYQKTPPPLEITTPSDEQKFSAEERQLTIVGTTDPGNKVTINDRLVIVDQDGKFSYLVTLSEGENNFKITASDPAGNQTTLQRKVTFTP